MVEGRIQWLTLKSIWKFFPNLTLLLTRLVFPEMWTLTVKVT
jgi:hypothetical protein